MIHPKNKLAGAVATGLALLVAVGSATASVNRSPVETKCAVHRQRILTRGVSDQLRCHGKAALRDSEVAPGCLAKARAKLSASWRKNDAHRQCPLEDLNIPEIANEHVRDFVEQVLTDGNLGLDPSSPHDEFTNANRLVFFLPMCQGRQDWGEPNPVMASILSVFGGSLESWPKACMPSAASPAQLQDFPLPHAAPATQTLASPTEFDFFSFIDPLGTAYDDQPSYSFLNHPKSWASLYCRNAAINMGFFDLSPVDLFDGPSFDIWISTAISSPSSRFKKGGGRYVLPSGTVVADNWPELTDGTLDHAIDELVDATPVPANAVAWTATDAAGQNTNEHCSAWRDPDGTATAGLPSSDSAAWTDTGVPGADCSAPLAPRSGETFGVYCFQQDGADPSCHELPDGGCAGTCSSGGSCRPLTKGGCGCSGPLP